MKFLYCELNNDYAYTATPAVYQPPAKTPIDDANVWKIGIDIDTADLIKDDAADPKYSRDSFKAYLQSPAGYSDLTDNQIENVLNRFFPAAAQSGETPADIPAKLTDADISKALQDNGINIDASKQSVAVRDNLRIIASNDDLLQKFAEQNNAIGAEKLLASLNVPKSAGELKSQLELVKNNLIWITDKPDLKDMFHHIAQNDPDNFQQLINALSQKDYSKDDLGQIKVVYEHAKDIPAVLMYEYHAKALGFDNVDALAKWLGYENADAFNKALTDAAKVDGEINPEKARNIILNLARIINNPELKSWLVIAAGAERGGQIGQLITAFAQEDIKDPSDLTRNIILHGNKNIKDVITYVIKNEGTLPAAVQNAVNYLLLLTTDKNNPILASGWDNLNLILKFEGSTDAKIELITNLAEGKLTEEQQKELNRQGLDGLAGKALESGGRRIAWERKNTPNPTPDQTAKWDEFEKNLKQTRDIAERLGFTEIARGASNGLDAINNINNGYNSPAPQSGDAATPTNNQVLSSTVPASPGADTLAAGSQLNSTHQERLTELLRGAQIERDALDEKIAENFAAANKELEDAIAAKDEKRIASAKAKLSVLEGIQLASRLFNFTASLEPAANENNENTESGQNARQMRAQVETLLNLLPECAEPNAQTDLEALSAGIVSDLPSAASSAAEKMLKALETRNTVETIFAEANIPYAFMDSVLSKQTVNLPREVMKVVASLIVELHKIKNIAAKTRAEAVKYLEEMIKPLSVKLWEAGMTITEYKKLEAELDNASTQSERIAIKERMDLLLRVAGQKAGETPKEFIFRLGRGCSHLDTSLDEIAKNNAEAGEILDDIVDRQSERLDEIKEMLYSGNIDEVLKKDDLSKPEIELVKRLLTRELASAPPEELQRLASITADPELKVFIQKMAEDAEERDTQRRENLDIKQPEPVTA
jgi:hypothetical protein